MIINPVTKEEVHVPAFLINPRYVSMGLAYSLEFDNELSELTDEEFNAVSPFMMLDHTGA